jgi:hypothetical protein
MLRILDNDQWIVEEDTFRFGLTNVVLIRALTAIAVVPVKTCDLVKVDHMYMFNIYKVRHWCNTQSRSTV